MGRTKRSVGECLKIASSFPTRKEFREKDFGAYLVLRKEGLLEEAQSHMRDTPPVDQGPRFVYLAESQVDSYAGMAKNVRQRIWSHKCSERKDLKKLFRSPELVIKQWGPFPYYEAAAKEKALIAEIKNSGKNALNRSKGGEMGSTRVKWTKEKLEKLVSGLTVRHLLRINPSAYRCMMRHPDKEYLKSLMV